MAAQTKVGGAMGSALPDPTKDSAALPPIPSLAIENKPAPGQTGPKGMAPRTTYSRVNTGSPPVMDAGALAQKGSSPRGMEFLPAKVASSRGSMNMQSRPLLQDMVKAAMASSSQQLAVNIEAARQVTNQGSTKTASASPSSSVAGHVPTELVNKLASALGYIREQLIKEADLGPGEGPNALRVMEATSSETNIDAGESGQATAHNQPPRTPPKQPEQVQEGNAGTGLQTNDDTTHPEQPTEPIKNAAANLLQANLSRLQKLANRQSPSTKTAAPISLIRKVAAGIKVAEDAINPAHISSPASVDPTKPPPGASPSEEGVPSEPGDVTSQKRLISSNTAAIDYTKGQAKADPKKDVNQLLTEPALSSSSDKVLDRVWDNTGQAGVKISSAKGLVKQAQQTGAQRILLDRLLQKVATEGCKDKEPGKDKRSTGMAPTTPQAATGANAATMGM